MNSQNQYKIVSKQIVHLDYILSFKKIKNFIKILNQLMKIMKNLKKKEKTHLNLLLHIKLRLQKLTFLLSL